MKKRILSVLFCLCMMMVLLPTTALAWIPDNITVNNATYHSNGTLASITASFNWHTGAASSRLVLMTQRLRSAGEAGTDSYYGDFTDCGAYGSSFSSFDAVCAYDTSHGNVFGIKSYTEEEQVTMNSQKTMTMYFSDGLIPLNTDGLYYVYLWTQYMGYCYPDTLICAIQVQDGAVKYAAATDRNAYDEGAFADVGSPETYDVAVISDSTMTRDSSSGEATQSSLTGAMTPVVYTANAGYYFPDTYNVATVNGIMVRRDSAAQITVYGTPSANATITLQPCTPIVHSSHPLCGASCSHSSDTHSNVTWTGVSTLTNDMAAGDYYLTGDVTLSTTWEPQNNIALCLNGHTIKANGNFDAITVASSKTFTLTDCEATQGKITHGTGQKGRGVYVASVGIFNMYGGNIANNTVDDSGDNQNGGGVYSSGTFNMYGGSITNCMVTGTYGYGGGVYISSGTFNMYGGSIANNTANIHGGGVYSVGTFNIFGGSIDHNAANSYGGGVFTTGIGSNFTISGGSIDHNTAGSNGGGVCNPSGTFTMSGGSIANNTASGYGGGVFKGYGTFTVSGSVNVSGNAKRMDGLTADQANNVYLAHSRTITIDAKLTNTTPIGVTMEPPGVFTSGWSTNMSSGVPTTYFASDSANYAVVLENNELKLERVQAATYTVTFNANGHGTAPVPQTVDSGTSAVEPIAPTADGYTFGGWYTDAACTSAWNFATPVTANITLYARWTYTGSSNDDDDDDYTPTYKVETSVSKDADGTVSVKPSTAEQGDKVTITVTPDRYYKVDGVTVKDQNGKKITVTENADGTFTFKMPASKVTVEPVFSWDNPFADVAENAYYASAVEWALKNDVTGGTTATTFSPNAVCTRAQAVTFLWRAAGCPEPAGTNSFTDVSADAYYAKAVAWAVEQGITNGTGGGKFSPDAVCTRAQVVAFLWRAEGSDTAGTANSFADVPTNAYYTDAVNWAVENSITGGTSATTFSPAANCTRAQIVTFLYRDMVE